VTLEPTDFLTSDTQLFDESLVKWRFADSLERLHERTARDWDATVPADATVLVLGDAVAYRVAESLEWFSQRPGTKILITGNWDEVNPLYAGTREVADEGWHEIFTGGIFDRGSVFIGPVAFMASHYTYNNTAKAEWLVDRGCGWKDTGMPLLHGHTHSRKRVTRSTKGTLQLHVGLDAWKKPVSGQQILERAEQEGW
jgi:calcineurin-like phosphoesterase family protein